MSEELNRLFAVLSAGASHAIDVAGEDEGLRVEMQLTVKGMLIEALMQKTPPFSLHRPPDGYCNHEITWDDLVVLDAVGLKALIDELLRCAVSGEDDGGEDGRASGTVVPFGRRRP